MRGSTRTALALCAAVFVGCASAPVGGETVTETEHRERAAEAWEVYERALIVGDADRAVSIFAEDVRLVGEGEFAGIEGRSAYRDVLSEMLPAATFLSLRPRIDDVLVLGDHVWESGTYTESFRLRETGETISVSGAYGALWAVEDGEWRIRRFVWNTDPPSTSADP